MRTLAVCLLLVLFAAPAMAQTADAFEDPWFSTFSIVAFDPDTNDRFLAVAHVAKCASRRRT